MRRILIIDLVMSLFITFQAQHSPIPVATVTGPVQGPGTIFCASTVDLKAFGYVEEEYFLEGKARTYSFVNYPGNAVPNDTLKPFKTRIIVRKPLNASKFSGTVLVEWLNVSSKYDIDVSWCQLSEHLMRSGYAWVGVSVQRDGIHTPTGLVNWNPERYGSLNVMADMPNLWDPLSADIFSQSIRVLKESRKVRPLGSKKPGVIIATGHSQSAIFLAGYFNAIHPITGLIDGFMIMQGGDPLRTEIDSKVFRINTETDLVLLDMAVNRQSDTDRMVTWEISGTSHADQRFMDHLAAINKRDFGFFTPPSCQMPLYSVIPFNYAYSAALDHMVSWIRESVPPPAGLPVKVNQRGTDIMIVRDSMQNALGGIRLPQFAVPVAMNSGINSGDGFCPWYGTHREFEPELLKALYPTHQDFLNKFIESIKENLSAGYILKADTSAMLDEARELATHWK
jgi:hypothetical protein